MNDEPIQHQTPPLPVVDKKTRGQKWRKCSRAFNIVANSRRRS